VSVGIPGQLRVDPEVLVVGGGGGSVDVGRCLGRTPLSKKSHGTCLLALPWWIRREEGWGQRWRCGQEGGWWQR
jgi:hypothetical protein